GWVARSPRGTGSVADERRERLTPSDRGPRVITADSTPASDAPTARQRRALRVHGTVQGVGFRPAVCRLACDLALGGFVRTDLAGVSMGTQADAAAVARFIAAVPAAVPLARIDRIETRAVPPVGERAFVIAPSDAAGTTAAAAIPPDLAPCATCLRELA